MGDQLTLNDRTISVTACDSEGLWVHNLLPRQSAISYHLSGWAEAGWRKLKKKEKIS